jgi:hypothetical protein
MMGAMSPKTLFGFCAVLAISAAGTAALSELNQASGSTSVIWIMISRFVLVMAFGTFGLYAAQGSNLQGSVAATAEDAQSAFLIICSSFGIGTVRSSPPGFGTWKTSTTRSCCRWIPA